MRMRWYWLNVLLVLFTFSFMLNANVPTIVPWPVGYTLDNLEITKTIMNSYGDPNVSIFHTGIDIQYETTGCDQVRCVYGYDIVSAPDEPDVIITDIYEDFKDGFTQYSVVTTEGTDSLMMNIMDGAISI